jgi:hypothetical protein
MVRESLYMGVSGRGEDDAGVFAAAVGVGVVVAGAAWYIGSGDVAVGIDGEYGVGGLLLFPGMVVM